VVLSKAGGTRLTNANQHSERLGKKHLYKLDVKALTQVFLNFIYREGMPFLVKTGPCCAMRGGCGNQQRLNSKGVTWLLTACVYAQTLALRGACVSV
jgi:hypothetical protein